MQYVEILPAIRSKYALRKDWKIIQFFEKYGKEATEIAYKKKRQLSFFWKQKLQKAGGNCQHWSRGQST